MGVKLNEKGELVQDDGALVALPDGVVLVKKDEHERLSNVGKRLDSFELRLSEFGTSRQPETPAPAGPSIEQQQADIDVKLEKIDAQIETAEAALAEGKKPEKSIAALTRERATLERRRSKIESDANFNALAGAGMESIATLTHEVTKGQMALLKVPEVKAAYDKMFAGLPAAQRTSAKVLLEVYNLAVGQNVGKVTEYTIAEANRRAADAATQTPGATSLLRVPKKNPDGSDALPTFEEHFGQGQVDFLRTSFGKSPDEWARGLGYKDSQDYVRADIESTQKGATH